MLGSLGNHLCPQLEIIHAGVNNLQPKFAAKLTALVEALWKTESQFGTVNGPIGGIEDKA
jgi:hypothetical protein